MITNNSQWTAVISPTNSFASLSLGKRPKTLVNWLLAKRPQFISVNHLNIFFKFPPAPDDCPPGELECPRKDVEQIAFNAQGQVCTITPSECLPANIWYFRYISNSFSRWTFTKQSGPFYHFKYDFSFHYNFMYLEEKSEWDTKPVPRKTFTTSHSNHPEIFRNVKPNNLGQKSISFLYQLHFSFFGHWPLDYFNCFYRWLFMQFKMVPSTNAFIISLSLVSSSLESTSPKKTRALKWM